MFGFGRKDKDGKQVRIEHRGKHTRASRTGGVSLRVEKKAGPVNVTANTSKGVRLSSKVARGTRVALQNGKFRLIGRWKTGPINFNLSKTGASASVKNRMGAFNFLKPQYSSFKFAGIHVRGVKAARLQLIYMLVSLTLMAIAFLGRALILLLWLLWLVVAFLFDVISEVFRIVIERKADEQEDDDPETLALVEATGAQTNTSDEHSVEPELVIPVAENLASPDDVRTALLARSKKIGHIVTPVWTLLAVIETPPGTDISNLLAVVVFYGLLWFMVYKIAFKIYDSKQRKRSVRYRSWAEQQDEEKRNKLEKERREREAQYERDERERRKKNRLKDVKQNVSGGLLPLSDIKVCYWCGAEENFLEFMGGEIVRREWAYMNKDGSPDRRKRDNPEVVTFDSSYRCKNCKAINSYRHYSSDEPYEKGPVTIAILSNPGMRPFNETGFLRDKKTKEVLVLPAGDSLSEFLNSENVYHKVPFWR